MSTASLRRDALKIWSASVEAVRPEKIVPKWMHVANGSIVFGSDDCENKKEIPLDSIRRIAVVGAGKAGASMAAAVENTLGNSLMTEKNLVGWVNVPEDCVGESLRCIHLHPARPAGVNEPTAEGVSGSQQILDIVELLGPNDLCICLISGGGSALLPSPVEGVSLADKLAVTRFLSAAGANIEQLNAVRKPLSRIKGGGLDRACKAGNIVSLIISDVLGNPLDVIASGPTVPCEATPHAALDVLKQFGMAPELAPSVFDYLEKQARDRSHGPQAALIPNLQSLISPFIIADNATAVAAAAEEARKLGYAVEAESESQSEGLAEDVGRRLAAKSLKMRAEHRSMCFISGGEPVVQLAPSSRRGLGGRNQQLILAAVETLFDDGAANMALLSGGTDGEDGPTNAAGAFCDAEVIAAARRLSLQPAEYLARNDAYHFFEPLGGLIKTGPTQTNVCDVRVALCGY